MAEEGPDFDVVLHTVKVGSVKADIQLSVPNFAILSDGEECSKECLLGWGQVWVTRILGCYDPLILVVFIFKIKTHRHCSTHQ